MARIGGIFPLRYRRGGVDVEPTLPDQDADQRMHDRLADRIAQLRRIGTEAVRIPLGDEGPVVQDDDRMDVPARTRRRLGECASERFADSRIGGSDDRFGFGRTCRVARSLQRVRIGLLAGQRAAIRRVVGGHARKSAVPCGADAPIHSVDRIAKARQQQGQSPIGGDVLGVHAIRRQARNEDPRTQRVRDTGGGDAKRVVRTLPEAYSGQDRDHDRDGAKPPHAERRSFAGHALSLQP